MKISLINAQYFEGNNIVPPLGLLYLAAQLEKEGHDVQVFDCDPDVPTALDPNVLDEVVSFQPQVVGLSFFTNTYQKARYYLGEIRRLLPQATVVLGGIHCSSVPQETFDHLRPDYLVVGEGEYVLADLCRCLERDDMSGIAKIKGLYSWQNGKPAYLGPSIPIENLDDLEFPARRLLPFERYLSPPGLIRGYALDRMTTLITSRGCYYPCIYCASHKSFGKKIRRRTVANVIQEIDELVDQYGIRSLYICDDIFTEDEKWVLSFSEALQHRPYRLAWACQSRVDTLSEELMYAMRDAGCIQIDFGVESGSMNTLKTLKKKTTNREAPALFASLHKKGIRSCATFIIGNPYERIEDLKDTFDFAKVLKSDYTAFYYSTPYPGTELHRMAIENGWLDPNLEYSTRWSHRQVDIPIMEAGIDLKQLASYRKRMQNRFFIGNYFHLHNFRFYGGLLAATIQRPFETLKAITRLFLTGRLENLAETLLRIYRLKIDSGVQKVRAKPMGSEKITN